MSKFDRGVLIFIGLGIWALAMTQVFEPLNLKAESYIKTVKSEDANPFQPNTVFAKCPAGKKAEQFNFVANADFPHWDKSPVSSKYCTYLLVATYSDLINHREHFNEVE